MSAGPPEVAAAFPDGLGGGRRDHRQERFDPAQEVEIVVDELRGRLAGWGGVRRCIAGRLEIRGGQQRRD